MTVSNQNVQTVTALGNGITTNFTIGFLFQDNDYVEVYLQEESTPPFTRTKLIYGAGAGKYTITGGDPGTTVVCGTAPTATQRLVINRVTALVQPVDYDPNRAFPAEDHEEQMDRMVMIEQELNHLITKKIGLSDASPTTTPTFPEPIESGIILWNAAGTDLETKVVADLGMQAGDIEFTPVGTITAADVQAAVEEVATDAASSLASHTGNLSNPHSVTAAQLGAGAIVSVINGGGSEIDWDNVSKTGSSIADLTTKSHTDLTDTGTNTHAQIDSHIASTANPHSVSASQVGNDTAQWNANKILGVEVDDTAKSDSRVLKYDLASDKLVYAIAGSGHGDVVGPIASTDGVIAVYDGATGKLLKNSTVTVPAKTGTLQIVEESYQSVGPVTIPTLTDNGDGTVTTNTIDVALRTSSDSTGFVKKYTVTGLTNQALTDNTTNYIVADYNGGTPIQKVITNVALITESDVCPIFTIFRNGTSLHYQDWGTLGNGLTNKVHQSIVKTQRYRRESGLTITESGTRNVSLDQGVVWIGGNKVTLTPIASATDNMFFYYHVGGVWTLSPVTQYNNNQYDNGTDLVVLSGAGTQYAVNWLYRGVETPKHLYMVLGTGNYNLAQAQASQPPTLPTVISSHALLVGRIIVAQAASTATQIDSAFATVFTSSAAATSAYTVTATKTANYSANANEFIPCDSSGGTFTVTLPASSGWAGKQIVIKKVDSSDVIVTIDADSSETIDGALTKVLSTQWDSVTLVSNGTNVYIQ